MAIVTAAQVSAQLGIAEGDESDIVSVAIVHATGAVKRFLRYDPEQKTWTQYYPMMNFDPLSAESVWEVEGSQAVLRRRAEAATSELQLQHLPIRSVTSLAVDYDGRSDTQSGSYSDAKTEGTDFWPNYDTVDSSSNKVCRDGIIRSVGAWPTTPGSIKVTYTAGYTTAELRGTDTVVDASPIWATTLMEAVRYARATIASKASSKLGVLAGPLEAERLGDYNYKASTKDLALLASGNWDLLPSSKQALNDFVNYGWNIAS